jgi:hypothetical protein
MHNMLSQPQPPQNGVPQIQPFIIIAITLFAFSGLVTGFTFGTFIRPSKSTANNSNPIPITTNHTTPTPTSTPQPTTQVPIKLGCPALTVQPTSTTPTIVYNVALQAKDKSGYSTNGCNLDAEQSITADGITCRIWLVQDDPKNPHAISDQLSKDSTQLQHTDLFSQLFPGEIPNALILDPSTPTETQACAKGKGEWKFTLSSSLNSGNYNLVGLTDWNGLYYNWSWKRIVVSAK